ncbi:class I SAM-dependent methyltransferase [Streptomyces sp. NPDC007088]|uniref:class I SAM-dependent methyltransferase n=1 Tax=Streptomyces sp. NPDC007088 TaxID=3364773 RepID=UPI0036B72223
MSAPARSRETALPSSRTGLVEAPAGLPWSGSDDPWGEAVRTGRGPLFLRREDGWLLPLDVERWCAAPDAADTTVLDRCRGTVLDIGCGPGRFLIALAERKRTALGVDLCRDAVARALDAGAGAVCRSVFGPLPGTGRWDTALLIDGNIGIGGDPVALLGRSAELVAPQGLLIVETAPLDLDERVLVRVGNGSDQHGPPFPWARVGTPALLRYAREAGWIEAERWTAAGRHFAALRRAPGAASPTP